VAVIDALRQRLPQRYRQFAKFLAVGGTTWVIDTGLFFLLKHTVLPGKVMTAKVIAILVAMIVNYVLNREWSFSNRGGRERHHEAALFFLLNGIGIVVNLFPLWVSHYILGLNASNVSAFSESLADFISGSIIGTAIAMVFRYWAYRRWVFPELLSESEPDDPARNEDDFSFNVPPAPRG
jgi:putative flippase GtrA